MTARLERTDGSRIGPKARTDFSAASNHGVNDMAAKTKKKKAARGGKAAGRKTARKAKAKSSRGKVSKAKKPSRKPAARATKKAAAAKPARKKKQVVGEGDYAASRKFLKDQAGFVASHQSEIPGMGKQAERALEGPEGDSLRDAEAAAAGRSRDRF
jgi:hypothetical protein